MGGDVRISQSAITQEFFLAAALGLCRVSVSDTKFGYAPELANGAVCTIWAGTKASVGQLVYVFPDSGGETVEAVSSVAGDTTQSIQVEGLDVNGLPQTEVIDLNGTTVVPSGETWLAIDRAFVVGAIPVVGEVVVQGDGVTSVNVFAVILPAEQQTVQAATMVPADKVMAVVGFDTALNKAGAQAASAVLRLAAKKSGGVQRTARRYGLQLEGSSNVPKNFIIPAVFPPLSQVSVTAEFTVTSGTGDISAEFAYSLINSSAIPADVLASL